MPSTKDATRAIILVEVTSSGVIIAEPVIMLQDNPPITEDVSKMIETTKIAMQAPNTTPFNIK